MTNSPTTILPTGGSERLLGAAHPHAHTTHASDTTGCSAVLCGAVVLGPADKAGNCNERLQGSGQLRQSVGLGDQRERVWKPPLAQQDPFQAGAPD